MRPQSMAQTVRDLEDAGLVSRRPDPRDGRRSFVELTPAGLQTLHDTRARREDWLTEILDRELEPEQRELLRRALTLLDRVAGA
jgi:DNA-binding MarR family transcriptional regulator